VKATTRKLISGNQKKFLSGVFAIKQVLNFEVQKRAFREFGSIDKTNSEQ
jgi:hypothetical protein